MDRRHVNDRKPQHGYGEPKNIVSSSAFATSFSSCSSVFPQRVHYWLHPESVHYWLHEHSNPGPMDLHEPSNPGPMDLRHWFGSGLLNIFVCLVSCHVCYLFVLRDVLFRLNGAERRKSGSLNADKRLTLMYESERSAERRALSSMSGLWVFSFAIPQIFVAVLSSLSTGLDGDRACAIALAILLALYLVVEKQIQRLRQDSSTLRDEEAQGHQREEPDLRTLPAIGRETSLAIVQKVKRRLGTYMYQQDS